MITLVISMLTDEQLEQAFAELRRNLLADRLDLSPAGLWSKAILDEKHSRGLEWTI